MEDVTATFLLTDVQGSTRMWLEAPTDASVAFARLDEIIAQAAERRHGRVARGRGEGDSALCVFDDPVYGVQAALDAQRAIHEEMWPPGAPIRVRMAVHTGIVEERGEEYFGYSINYCGRLRDTGTGGQILVSEATADLVGDAVPSGTELVSLGSVSLRDIPEPVEVLSLLHDELPAARTPVRGFVTVQHNLPVTTTSFVGRDRTLRSIAKLLEEHPVVTVTGPGGVGKTRTASRVAAEVVGAYEAGVRLLELGSLEPDRVALSVATAIHADVDPDGDPIEAVVEQLRGRNMLLFLDNCEHVVDAAAAVVDAVVRGCPDVSVLATSRRALGVAGERRVVLPPLELPEPGAGFEEMATTEAFRLFDDRATAVRSDFEIGPDNADAVATVCRALDGIPLAIELAAARMGVLTPAQIAERLDGGLSVLAEGPRLGVDRHRTPEDVVAWSTGLLPDAEQAVFRRLAIFEGGSTLEAAEAVCAAEDLAKEQVLDRIAGLVDHSLLAAEVDGARMRYRMLETVRAFASSRLDASGERERTAAAHLAWCGAFAAAFEASATSDEPPMLDAVAAELANIRAAVRFASGSSERARTGLKLVADLLDFWQNRAVAEGASHAEALLRLNADRDGHRLRGLYVHGILHDTRDLGVARRSLTEAFEIAGELGDRVWTARLHTTLSVVSRLEGELDEAESRAREALAIMESVGDESWQAQAAEVLARVMESRGRFPEAKELHSRALGIWGRRGEHGRMSYPLLNLGAVYQITGELAEARTALRRAAEIARDRGDRKTLVVATTNLGRVALADGDPDTARRMFEESLAISTELDSTYDIAYARAFLGNHARQIEDLDRAHYHYERALELFERNGNAVDADFVRVMLGRVALAQGRTDAARAAGDRTLRDAVAREDRHSMCEFLEMLSLVTAAEGEPDRAAMLFGRVERLRDDLGVPRELVDEADWRRWTAAVREALGGEPFEAARAAGGELRLEDALVLALRAT